jgi:Ser/Thr protein kinase RdoA (MazF antagonist)
VGTPQLPLADAARLAGQYFGLRCVATALPSERDQNFRLVTAAGERFVLKIANSAEDRAVLELQHAALRHAGERVRSLALPRVVPALDGRDIVMPGEGTACGHMLRLFSWLDGEPMARVEPCDDTLLASLGTCMAELDLALRAFSHAAMHRELHWDVRHAAQSLRHLPLLGAEDQEIVRLLMRPFDAVPWQALRTQVIHGDANDYNVLVREGRVAGFLDFGDMVHSALACDLAIALAYAMLGKGEPLRVAQVIIAAYTAACPLARAEAESLFALATARLCLSVCIAARNAREKSDDPYQQVSAGPAWKLLRQLAALPADAGRNAFLGACTLA